ncbi:MAG: chemotaxis protein CheC [Eubacteriales bacterium]
MAERDRINLNDMPGEIMDMFKELGNIGAGNATTALAQMLQCHVDMKVPSVKVLDFCDVGSTVGGEEQIMVAIYLNVEGDIAGSIMYMQAVTSANHILSKMLGEEIHDKYQYSEMQLSALKEIGNIITGSYLNSLAALTRLKIIPSIPSLSIDMAGAILSVPAIEFGQVSDKILLIQTQFTDEVEIDGYFLLVPDLASYDVILNSLGMN